MPIISVASAKGGAGKTTSALALAAALAADPGFAATPPVLWDLDPDGDATLRLGFPIEPELLGPLLVGRTSSAERLGSYLLADAAHRTAEHFDLVPASIDNGDVESHYGAANGGLPLVAFRLKKLCADRTVIIDTTPGLRTLLCRAALSVADVLVIHVVPEPLAERHVLSMVSTLRGLGGNATVLIVATMVGTNPGPLSALRVALSSEKLAMNAVIPREAVVNDAIWTRATALGAAPGSRSAESYVSLARQVQVRS